MKLRIISEEDGHALGSVIDEPMAGVCELLILRGIAEEVKDGAEREPMPAAFPPPNKAMRRGGAKTKNVA